MASEPEPPRTYDCGAFINYLPRMSGGSTPKFLDNILGKLDPINQELVKGMIGIITNSAGVDLPPDLTLLYDNWGPDAYNTYIDIIKTEFLGNNPAEDEAAINNLQQFSGFLLNFYFCFNSPGTDVKPEITNPGSKYYFSQTDSLLNFFKSEFSRGIGNKFVKSYCDSILEDVDIKDRNKYLSQNPRLMKWCGCFAEIYEFMTMAEEEDFPQECYPICINSGAIKLYNDNGTQKTCISNICVIDDISIKTVETPNGFVNFNKLCTGCINNPSDLNCFCIIDSSVLSLLGKIGAGKGGLDSPVNFNFYCPNATCLIVNEIEQVVEKVECNEFNPAATGVTPQSSSGSSISTDGVSLDDEASLLFILLSCFFIFLCIGIYSFGKSIFVKKSSF